jgi:hypothetical protein
MYFLFSLYGSIVMNRKLLVLFGIVLTLILTSTALTVTSENNEKGLFGKTNLRAIGRNFHICEDDGGLYGHIFLGMDGFKPVFNKDIYIPEENIRFILIINSFYVHCKYI